MRELLMSKNWTRKDDINSRTAQSMQDVESSEIIVVVGIAQIKTDEAKEGEVKNVTCLKTDDGRYISTISESIFRMGEDLADIIDEEEQVKVSVSSRKAKSGREFLVLTLVD